MCLCPQEKIDTQVKAYLEGSVAREDQGSATPERRMSSLWSDGRQCFLDMASLATMAVLILMTPLSLPTPRVSPVVATAAAAAVGGGVRMMVAKQRTGTTTRSCRHRHPPLRH